MQVIYFPHACRWNRINIHFNDIPVQEVLIFAFSFISIRSSETFQM